MPLTKMDTQITMRFAKEFACSFTNIDCSRLDFFYTIRASASIVGGPSAGAPATLLTISALDGVSLDSSAVITGTINSGGIIGPVGGVNEKIVAARNAGFDKVLIPKWSFANDTNISIFTSGIEVVKVVTVDEALTILTGVDYLYDNGEIIVDEEYSAKMFETATEMCNRTSKLIDETGIVPVSYNLSRDALEDEDYYSAASFCFSSNIQLRKSILENSSIDFIVIGLERLGGQIVSFNEFLDNKELRTITDFQTFIIVKERVLEAERLLDSFWNLSLNDSSIYYTAALAYERFYSAVVWSGFFDLSGEVYDLDSDHLRNTCFKKLEEAEQTISYVNYYLPSFTRNSKKTLDGAKDKRSLGEYELCIFEASKAKAEASIIVTALGISSDSVGELVSEKLKIVSRAISREQDSGIFPILAYSYYEYSNSLKESDPYSSLLYAEYALELSNVRMYFEKESFDFRIPRLDILFSLIIGIIIGSFITYFNVSSGVGRARRRK
jgi:predicted S18 family serine protease